MKILSLIILTAALLFSACQPDAPRSNSGNSADRQTVGEANTAPNATTSAPAKSKIKTGDGTGTVTKLNAKLGSVALDHDEIKGIMPAMEGMEFYVSDVKMLDKLKIGDKVDFVLEDNAGAERIIRIKKRQ